MMIGFNILDTDQTYFLEFDQDNNYSGKALDVQMDESLNQYLRKMTYCSE